MKYKIWDKKNQCWATSNIMVDLSGVLYYTFGSNIEMIDDPENYEVFWQIGQESTSGKTVFSGDVVVFDVVKTQSDEVGHKNLKGTVKWTNQSGVSIDGWRIEYCRITKILGHSKDIVN